jgi:hypothetical protein
MGRGQKKHCPAKIVAHPRDANGLVAAGTDLKAVLQALIAFADVGGAVVIGAGVRVSALGMTGRSN